MARRGAPGSFFLSLCACASVCETWFFKNGGGGGGPFRALIKLASTSGQGFRTEGRPDVWSLSGSPGNITRKNCGNRNASLLRNEEPQKRKSKMAALLPRQCFFASVFSSSARARPSFRPHLGKLADRRFSRNTPRHPPASMSLPKPLRSNVRERYFLQIRHLLCTNENNSTDPLNEISPQ